MSEEENGLFGNAGEIYFSPVEGESGLDLTLEESVRLQFVGLIEDRFEQSERAREHDEARWLQAYDLENLKSLECLSKSRRLKLLQLLGS